VNSRLVDEFVSVDDGEIVDAMRFLFDRMKIVVEPSGAVGVAALLQGRVPPDGTVAIVLSGGNVGAERFADLVRPSGSG
jgi:threonine dehydratase